MTDRQNRIPKGHTGGGRWTKGSLGFGGVLGNDADDAMSEFQEHRRLRVKLAKLKRKAGANPTAAQKQQMATLAADVARHKAAFDRHRKSALKNGVSISASGDVVAGGKQYAKGGKIIAQPNPAKQTPVTKQPPKKQTASGVTAKQTTAQKTTQQQIDDGVMAFKEHRKWRVKAIQLKKKMNVVNNPSLQQQYQQAVQKRDTAKSKLDGIRKSLNASGSVKFKSNGDVIVNGVQTHKGGTPLAAVKKKAKPSPPKKATIPQPLKQPQKPKRPPRRIEGAHALQRAHKFMQKHYGQWLNNLTSKQVEALRDYIGFPSWMYKPGKDPKFYDKLNRALVGERTMTQKIKTAVKHMDTALDKTATPYDLIVHRGLNSQTVYNAVKDGKFDDSVMNSAKATKRFISTSLEPNTAKGFMQYKPGVGWVPPKHPVYMEIEVPKGSKGAPLSFASRFKNPYANSSSEFLLPRGTQFDIIEAKMVTEPGIGQVAHIKARIRYQP